LPQTISVDWQSLGYPAHLSVAIRDLWLGKNLPTAPQRFSTAVAPHGVVMVLIEP
jgi:hypothetical protein